MRRKMKISTLRWVTMAILATCIFGCAEKPRTVPKVPLTVRYEIDLSKKSVLVAGDGLGDGQCTSSPDEIDGEKFLTITFFGRGEMCRISVSLEREPTKVFLVNSIPVSMKFDVPVQIESGSEKIDAAKIPPGEHTFEVRALE
jgi:hypothetical protein